MDAVVIVLPPVGLCLYMMVLLACVPVQDNMSITPLTQGRISSYYYINHLTVRMFCDTLKADATVSDLIEVLSVSCRGGVFLACTHTRAHTHT